MADQEFCAAQTGQRFLRGLMQNEVATGPVTIPPADIERLT